MLFLFELFLGQVFVFESINFHQCSSDIVKIVNTFTLDGCSMFFIQNDVLAQVKDLYINIINRMHVNVWRIRWFCSWMTRIFSHSMPKFKFSETFYIVLLDHDRLDSKYKITKKKWAKSVLYKRLLFYQTIFRCI